MMYKEIALMSFPEWVKTIESLHDLVLSIRLGDVPDHEALKAQMAQLDEARSLLSKFKVVADAQISYMDEIFKCVKNEGAEGKNDIERKANQIARCRIYEMTNDKYERLFVEEGPPQLDLIEFMAKLREKSDILHNITTVIEAKAQAIMIQGSIVKHEFNVLQFAKT